MTEEDSYARAFRLAYKLGTLTDDELLEFREASHILAVIDQLD